MARLPARLAAARKKRVAKPKPKRRPMDMNDRRADWADAAMEAFLEVCPTDREFLLSDFLCDLRHWAEREGYDFDAANDHGASVYRHEVKDPEPLA